MKTIEQFFDDIAQDWDSKETHNKDEKTELLSKANIKIGDKVIDIACGTGVVTSLIHDFSKNDVYGIDLSSKMIEIAKEKYKDENWAIFEHQDVFALDETNKFDVAVIYNAYPHFKDPIKLSEKLSKILNVKGRFAILHSLSMTELNNHHKNLDSSLVRDIQKPEIEIEYFKNQFKILDCKEGQHNYYIIGEKL